TVTSRQSESKDRPWRLRADLLTTHGLLWVTRAGRGYELKPEVHLYFYDRYWRLAQYHERRGAKKKAIRLRAKAEAHYRRSGHDGPPFAAALAMPVPRPSLFTSAMATRSTDHPNDAA